MKRPIYLDYAATTPVLPEVAEKMMDSMKVNLKNLKDLNISVKDGKDEITIKTGK